MKGFYNMVLEVDASQRSFELKRVPDEVLAQTLGGKGLATHLLLENNPAGVDPLSPDNHLIFASGPVTNTGVWGSCRHGVYTKSPQTGFYSESYSGGTAAESMAATGYDAVMIHGASQEMVWLEISEEGAAFHPAEELRGLGTYETEDRIKQWIKDNHPEAKRSGVVVIGPAGENQVVFAVIENDHWRSAGRTGVGAVMGSKNIKGVAFWGNRAKEVADPGLMKSFAKQMAAIAKDDAGAKAYKSMGTPMLVDIMNQAGGFPSRYWHKGTSEHREGINADALHQRCQVQPHACLKCFIACGRLTTVMNGRHKGLTIEGPEYETIYAFGGLCEVADIEEIAYLNDICDRLGLDTMTGGNLAALTIEAVEQGKLEYDIAYGQVDDIARLLEDIAYKRGPGRLLAKGIKVAAEAWGMADQAIHVKGMEPAGYDPRVLKGMGLAYGTSDRGACHLRATFYKPELAGIMDPEQIKGKAEVFTLWEDRLTLFDTLILCRFFRDLYQFEQLATIIKCTTGLDLDETGMRAVAQRVSDDTRLFNLREGLTPDDDKLPRRFHEEALPETGKVLAREAQDLMLKEYYRARGWDEQGKPKRRR